MYKYTEFLTRMEFVKKYIPLLVIYTKILLFILFILLIIKMYIGIPVMGVGIWEVIIILGVSLLIKPL